MRFFEFHKEIEDVEFIEIAPQKPKLMITGHANHGKDLVCKYLRRIYGFKYSTSKYAVDKFIFDELSEKFNASSKKEFMEIKNSSNELRAAMFNSISEYNKQDPHKLFNEIMSLCNIYCGARRKIEVNWDMIDLSIWVDASERLPAEPSASMTLKPSDCDIVLNNNTSKEDLYRRIDWIMNGINNKKEFGCE